MRIWLFLLGLAATPLWSARSAETIHVVESHPTKGESLDGRSENFLSALVSITSHRTFLSHSPMTFLLRSAPDSAPEVSGAEHLLELSWIAYSETGEEIGGICG
jgi:hypothetical protein